MTLESTRKGIEKLNAINPAGEFAYEETFRAYQSILKMPALIDTIDKGTMITRSRPHKENEKNFNKISDIDIAPNESSKSYGRCNRPYQSKFYGSENRPTSYMEFAEYWLESSKPGDEISITLGQWELIKQVNLLIVGSPDPEKRIHDFDKYYGRVLDEFLAEFEAEAREAAILFYQFLFDVFRRKAKNDVKTYQLASGYTNLALSHAGQSCHGVIFPSIESKEQGLNFALNQHVANPEYLQLKRVIKNRLESYTDRQGKVSFRETDIEHAKNIDPAGNRIDW